MSSLKHSPLPTLQSLSTSFADLESVLTPLLSHKYDSLNAALQANSSSSALPTSDASAGPSTTDESSTDELRGRLDAARMQVSVAYVLMDLVWILLKTKGVDTSSHPVMQELERVKSYFAKIQRVQAKESEEEGDQSKIDKSAAGRFIRAALSGAAADGQGKHTKFDDDSSAPQPAIATPKKSKKKVDSTSKETGAAHTPATSDTTSPSKSKKKRPAMDPFEGYDRPATPKQPQTDSASSSPSKKKKKSKKTDQ